MARALAFYRRLGLEFPDGAESEGHVEATLPGGLRFMWDSEEMIRSFEPEWQRPTGTAVSLAFLCDSSADVDRDVRRADRRRLRGAQGAVGRLLGQRYAQVLDPDGNVIDLFARSRRAGGAGLVVGRPAWPDVAQRLSAELS